MKPPGASTINSSSNWIAYENCKLLKLEEELYYNNGKKVLNIIYFNLLQIKDENNKEMWHEESPVQNSNEVNQDLMGTGDNDTLEMTVVPVREENDLEIDIAPPQKN